MKVVSFVRGGVIVYRWLLWWNRSYNNAEIGPIQFIVGTKELRGGEGEGTSTLGERSTTKNCMLRSRRMNCS